MARLKKTDWIAAGLRMLADTGPESLKAEPMARALGNTKGSFYWHFADVPSFHNALISHWAERVNAPLFDRAEAADTHTAALRSMTQQIAQRDFGDHARAEPAIRAWALSNDQAARAVARVDDERLQAISALLERVGVSNRDIAHAILAAATGMPDDITGDPMGTLVDLVLALR
ncbi:TetR/AcrR family transcriptional regulator [Lutimaribacter sp. EGI FJ00015]|uniref:TetR/AcrR family transcriptional regulator n=1 Tax=Lutimaribacter degradans TaxID=2945989 RepID=A0ACC5ZYK8_9RHOB|nr:TetR/AcrR family transcriptional regulator [Lutimaribacter sp. EGI FJ00013]MCM2562629.1 TetR/AcrR family transcriptional regulator [Lutimaribacter sp. EGI FJ00013]MCO0613786.1 TetR/AcrR family transcriptional regulator [Lutimaribacter sp. EGI FJ00015]MCO0636731.1 TetR/AcrR family transcriptional regulator [Lutimaribacter sp. EGI FJ00014]